MTLRTLVVFGTRPEAIKVAPVIAELRARRDSEIFVCATAQHREMLDQVLRIFGVVPDRDLNVMRADQSLDDVTASVLEGVTDVVDDWRPDVLLVQGDTASAMAAALAAFYRRVPVGHIEAGLRTGIRTSPFPEEMARRIVTQIAELHFAPTRRSAENLRREHADVEGHVFLTGNTVVDAVRQIADRLAATPPVERRAERLLLVTAHRRENFGEPIRSICRALRAIVERHDDVEIVYPVHLNPNVQGPVRELLGGHERIQLVPPVDYEALVGLMRQAYLVLTDSGGLQEEAPVLGKPVLVLRRDTERPEAIEAGTAILVGTDEAAIVRSVEQLLRDRAAYARMAQAKSPFGDGHAAERIADALLAWKHDPSALARLRWDGTSELVPYVTHAAL
ncbi:MAG TPA: UDP-N-acetylglucosamine 2-epimerase (non-hydrolyzing) [Candidatus Limnocylindria bacterium]|nr:UDP-N-acetylglucosamine 2-epimerase (non-hydrolyzing) [Candidatus Limnocylindria bacterium]